MENIEETINGSDEIVNKKRKAREKKEIKKRLPNWRK